MSRIWLTSDWHLGHANIAGEKTSNWKEGYRTFDSVSEMDENIINTMNNLIGEDDVIYYLGDFVFGGHEKIPAYRDRIVCKTIHYILGNHDKHIVKYRNCFNSIQTSWDTTIRKIPITLYHYAQRIWLGSHKGFYHAYGHSHASLENKPYGRSMDVGVDNAYRLYKEYRPFEFEEFIALLENRNIEFPDHHAAHTNVR